MKTPLNDLDVAHPTYFAAKTYLKINFQIAFTIKLRTSGVQIIQMKKHKKHFCFNQSSYLSGNLGQIKHF